MIMYFTIPPASYSSFIHIMQTQQEALFQKLSDQILS